MAITVTIATGDQHARVTVIDKGPRGEERNATDHAPGETIEVELTALRSVLVDERLPPEG